MKKILRRIDKIGQKAAQVQQAIASVPPKFAEFRESVLMTAGQLQQLRADVQSSVTDLRADNEDRLLRSLKEINSGLEIFRQAGFELAAVDMEVSPTHKLVVYLDKVEDVNRAALRSLISAHQDRKTIQALLSAMLQAEDVAEKVTIGDLTYNQLVIHVGPLPTIRLSWAAPVELPSTAALASQTPSAPPGQEPAPSAFTQSSYFERRASPAALEPAPPRAPAVVDSSQAEPAPLPGTMLQPPAAPGSARQMKGSDWQRDALERFKKMPSISKYR